MARPAAPTSSPARVPLHLTAPASWPPGNSTPPAAVQSALPPLDLGPLRTPAHLHAQPAPGAPRAGLAVAGWLAVDLTPHLPALEPRAHATIQPLLAAVPKVRTDQTRTDAAGGVCERPRVDKGFYRIMSAVDLEATFRKHEPDTAVLGSNAMFATTVTRIRAAVIVTAVRPIKTPRGGAAATTGCPAIPPACPDHGPSGREAQDPGTGAHREQRADADGRPSPPDRRGRPHPLEPGRLPHQRRWHDLNVSQRRDEHARTSTPPARRA